jgi:hypothetical protein
MLLLQMGRLAPFIVWKRCKLEVQELRHIILFSMARAFFTFIF